MKQQGSFVSGYFRGNFSTEQEIPLFSGNELPKGLEHYMVIYRGILQETEHITEKEQTTTKYTTEFKAINNVEVNWKETEVKQRSRIHAFSSLRFVSFAISDVHVVEGKTLAQIEGRVVGSIASRPFTEEEIIQARKDYEQDNDPFSVHNKEDHLDSNSGENHPSSDPSDPDPRQTQPGPTMPEGCNRKGCQFPVLQQPGCLSFFNRIYRWVVYALLIVLLLYVFFKCSQMGRMMVCKYQISSLEKDLDRIKARQDSLQKYIALTKNTVKTCGSNEEKKGASEIVETYFNLGDHSGLVEITFDTRSAPDRIEVIYDGKLVAETRNPSFALFRNNDYRHLIDKGYAQESVGSPLSFNYNYDPKKPTLILIRVIPNQEDKDTQWDYQVNCPK